MPPLDHATFYRPDQRIGGAWQEPISHKGQCRASQSCQPAGLPGRDQGARRRDRNHMALDNLSFHDFAFAGRHEFRRFSLPNCAIGARV